MANEANYPDFSHNHLPHTDWQTLGKAQLRVSSVPTGAVDEWLTQILTPFDLPENFVSRILNSMKEAVVRVLSPDTMEERFEHLEIVVLAPTGLNLQGKTWGFFRVERMSIDSKNESANGHLIEYYLYLDRNS